MKITNIRKMGIIDLLGYIKAHNIKGKGFRTKSKPMLSVYANLEGEIIFSGDPMTFDHQFEVTNTFEVDEETEFIRLIVFVYNMVGVPKIYTHVHSCIKEVKDEYERPISISVPDEIGRLFTIWNHQEGLMPEDRIIEGEVFTEVIEGEDEDE